MILYCSSGLFTTHMLQPILAWDFLRGCDSSINFGSRFSDVDADPCLPITVIPPWDQRLRLCTPWKGFDVLFFVCFPHSGPTAVLIEVQPGKRDQRRRSIQPWESQGLISDEWSLWCLFAFTQLWINSDIYTQRSWFSVTAFKTSAITELRWRKSDNIILDGKSFISPKSLHLKQAASRGLNSQIPPCLNNIIKDEICST